MLMRTADMPIEVESDIESDSTESEQLRNCRALLEYIDGLFAKRMEAGQVNFEITINACGTLGCLIGWYALDVTKKKNIVPDEADKIINQHFGITGSCKFEDDTLANKIFGGHCEIDISQRRAALVKHIERMEGRG